jgi:alpha-D-ribose 1-methylphosphonate 5-triphosphate synthase subunit PhnH
MNNLAAAGSVLPGFPTPVHDTQAMFRTILEAMSRPGKRLPIPVQLGMPHGFSEAAMSVLLSLADFDTPVWLKGFPSETQLAEFLTFHCGSPVVDHPSEAVFGLATADTAPELLTAFDPGLSEYPDRSATIVVVADSLENGNGAMIQGPGVKGSTMLRIAGTTRAFWEFAAANCARFPQGVDFIFVGGGEVACLPRSVTLKEVLCT